MWMTTKRIIASFTCSVKHILFIFAKENDETIIEGITTPM